MDNMIFGGLLEFSDNKELNTFLDNMEPSDSLKILEVGLTHSQQNGLYSLEESHILHLALIKLKESINKRHE